MRYLPKEAKTTIRDQLREARSKAIGDAEAYDDLLFVFERLGCVLTEEETVRKETPSLGKYKESFEHLARDSGLFDVPLLKLNITPFLFAAGKNILNSSAYYRRLIYYKVIRILNVH